MTSDGEITQTHEPTTPTGTIKVLGKSGDIPLKWDKNDPQSVAVMEKQFRGLCEQGYHAYRIDRQGQAHGMEIKEFDPEAEEIVMFGQLQGGSPDA